MIFGDRLVITKKGIYVNNETLATIGIQPEDKITLLPFRTFEYRKKEPGSQIRTDLLITPISPEKWPFVIRFVLRLRNIPGTLHKVFQFLKNHNINILFEECSHSGHHHSVLNVLGEVKELEAITIDKLIDKILEEGERRKDTLERIYDLLYKDSNNFDDAKKKIKYYYEDTPGSPADEEPRWFSGRKPLSWSAFEKFQEFISQKDEEIEPIEEWNYEKIMKKVYNEVEEKLKTGKDQRGVNYSDRKGIKYLETKKRLENKLINEKVGVYLATKFKKQKHCSLQEFLEQEIVETQPKIEDLEKKYHTNAETLYQRVEFRILPIKILLQAIIMYKRVMVERYKLLIIQDSLQDESIKAKLEEQDDLENRKVEQIPEGVYLYNIRFYDMVIKYPYLMNERLMVYSIKEGKGGENKEMLDVFRDIVVRLDKLMQDRHKLGKIETRLDLDPVIITTVESLSHASYHRAFMQHYACDTESAMIKFPDNFNISSLFMGNTSEAATDDDYSTLAIGSRDTDSNSLRLSPIPLDSLNRFREIEFEYQRKCSEQCETDGLKEFRSTTIDSKIDQSNVNLSEIDQNEADQKMKICKGSSMGIAHIFSKAIKQYESQDIGNPHYLNIWRIYNKTIEISKNYEAGSIIAIVQAVGDNFTGFTSDWEKNIEERLRIDIHNEFPHRHVSFRRLSIRELSAGKVFVSLPFKHPRRKEWMEKVIQIGKKAGFHSIYTIEEHTEPVTKKVADYIKKSDAMIQIIAVDTKLEKESAEYTNRFIWLMAEYLAAISNNLEVVRLIDIDTIKDYEIKIGRDHPFIEFRIIDPSSEFDKVVEKAFKELRDKLGRKLGLS